jgi:hypothetical protein
MQQALNQTQTQAPKPQALPCKYCQKPVWDSYFFCPNCGKKLKEPPFKFSWAKAFGIIIASFLLPPFGIIPAVKYLRINDNRARAIGLIALALTIILTVIVVILIQNLITTMTQTYNQIYEMQMMLNNQNIESQSQIYDLQNLPQ